ncbi:MAG TPA: S9 family peptidase, partial [Bacteroidota bacterium]
RSRSPVVRTVFVAVFIVLALPASAQQKKLLSWDQVFRLGEPRIVTSLPLASGWADSTHYLLAKGRGGALSSIDVITGKETPYHDLSRFKDIADSTIPLNNPASSSDDFKVHAYLKDGDIYVLDTETPAFKRLTTTEAAEGNPTVSPDGKRIAFTRLNDLYTIDLSNGKETRLTGDGSEVIYNGWAAWLYMEEILGRASHYRAFWWSPDSKRLAFFRFDETHVPVFPLFSADGVHGRLERTRYPAPGDTNPSVRVGIAPASGGAVTWADFDENADQYFGLPFWTPDGSRLLVQWMNRAQDTLKIVAVESRSGKRNDIYTEHQASWVEWLKNILFLKNGSEFLLQSDRDGWMHLYRYAADGSLKSRVTAGEWAVENVETVDEAHGLVYFTARKENSTRMDLYRAALDGTGLRRLTFGEFYHTVKVSPDGRYFVTTYSNVNTPSRMALCDNAGKVLRELGDSKTAAFDEYEIGKPELFRVTTPDGYALPVAWTLPVHFDPSQKYPVLISIYGGPDAGTVFDRWGGLGGQWFAREGLIQVAIDHRGSGHFGKKGTSLMFRNLGKWEMNDYIEVVKWLRARGFVDSTRIGITGGSYGGYVTCMALTAGAGYFTHGIAEFSVVDWRLYDSHYTERYMRTPAEDPEGYASGSVLTYAPRYKGLLRIVHGSLDDNVHMQNSIQLIDRLQDLGKHFEFQLYPDQRHGVRGAKATELRNETYEFYYQYLLEKPFPAELFAQPGIPSRRF